MYRLGVRFHVFADTELALGAEEQGAVFAALDALVPESGCVGPGRGGGSEIYFAVEAAAVEDAERIAREHLRTIFEASGVHATYVLSIAET